VCPRADERGRHGRESGVGPWSSTCSACSVFGADRSTNTVRLSERAWPATVGGSPTVNDWGANRNRLLLL